MDTTPIPKSHHAPETALAAVEALARARNLLLAEIEKRIVGQREVVDHRLVPLLPARPLPFGGRAGPAKTLLRSGGAEGPNPSLHPLQVPAGLQPSGIPGTDVPEEDHPNGRRPLRFVRGPVLRDPVLAD